MCISTICSVNWLRLASSLHRGKLGFREAQSFNISKRDNSVQYQWLTSYSSLSLRCISCASPVHALRITVIPSPIIKDQIKKYSVVRKGQIQDLLQDSSLLVEPVGKGTKSKKSRRKLGVTDSNEVALKKPSNSRRTRRKLGLTDPNEDSSLSEEPVEKATKSKKSRRKLDVTDSNEVFYRMEFDGASKGNPGKAGAGVILRNQDGSVMCTLKEGVGIATCNVAEYRAVILGLKVALSKGIQRIHVQGDSKLVCMQIQDLWKTSSQNIAELSKEAKELKHKFKKFRIHHIERKFNAEADALANAAVELKNGEINKVVASLLLEKPLQKHSCSRRTRSKDDIADPEMELLEASLPLGKPLERPSKSGRSSSKDSLLDTAKVYYQLEFDGASKGNPGRAGAGAVLRNQDGSVICKLQEGVGIATNNVAEYRACILGLKVALSKGIQRIQVQGDSKLVCMQIQELWKTKSQNIVALNMEAKKLISKFKEFHISHIYRELNADANNLANAAVELQSGEWTSNKDVSEGHVTLETGNIIKAN